MNTQSSFQTNGSNITPRIGPRGTAHSTQHTTHARKDSGAKKHGPVCAKCKLIWKSSTHHPSLPNQQHVCTGIVGNHPFWLKPFLFELSVSRAQGTRFADAWMSQRRMEEAMGPVSDHHLGGCHLRGHWGAVRQPPSPSDVHRSRGPAQPVLVPAPTPGPVPAPVASQVRVSPTQSGATVAVKVRWLETDIEASGEDESVELNTLQSALAKARSQSVLPFPGTQLDADNTRLTWLLHCGGLPSCAQQEQFLWNHLRRIGCRGQAVACDCPAGATRLRGGAASGRAENGLAPVTYLFAQPARMATLIDLADEDLRRFNQTTSLSTPH